MRAVHFFYVCVDFAERFLLPDKVLLRELYYEHDERKRQRHYYERNER